MKILQGKYYLLNTLLCSILVTSLIGCNSSEKEKPEPVKEVDNSIILSPDGVGPINGTTSFNMHQMSQAFSDFSVVEEVNYIQGNPFPAIRIYEGVNTILNVIPDASRKEVYSVIIEDNTIKNSLGHPLGTMYNEIYTYGQNEKCQPGTEDLAGKILCYAPNHHNILYVFNGLWSNPTAGKMPPADVLQAWALETIIWRPKD